MADQDSLAQDSLARLFEEHRAHLRGVAYRILGSVSDADDAVQDTWLRLSRSDVSDVDNLGGWLTTVVARVALTMLQSRKTRREEVGAAWSSQDAVDRLPAGPSPEDEAPRSRAGCPAGRAARGSRCSTASLARCGRSAGRCAWRSGSLSPRTGGSRAST